MSELQVQSTQTIRLQICLSPRAGKSNHQINPHVVPPQSYPCEHLPLKRKCDPVYANTDLNRTYFEGVEPQANGDGKPLKDAVQSMSSFSDHWSFPNTLSSIQAKDVCREGRKIYYRSYVVKLNPVEEKFLPKNV